MGEEKEPTTKLELVEPSEEYIEFCAIRGYGGGQRSS